MQDKEITPEHEKEAKDLAVRFQKFCDLFEKWKKYYGVTEYHVEFEIDSSEDDHRVDAYVWYSDDVLETKACTVYFDKNCTDIEKTAEHEALELLFLEIRVMASKRFGITSEMLDSAIHSMIVRLQRITKAKPRRRTNKVNMDKVGKEPDINQGTA